MGEITIRADLLQCQVANACHAVRQRMLDTGVTEGHDQAAGGLIDEGQERRPTGEPGRIG